MKKGQTLFLVEHQDGAGSQWSIAEDEERVMELIKNIICQPSNNQVCDVLEIQVVEKYSHRFELVKQKPKIEWKDIDTTPRGCTNSKCGMPLASREEKCMRSSCPNYE